MPPNLLHPVHCLLEALSGSPFELDEIQGTFTEDPAPIIHEYGLEFLAPYLGRTFEGQPGVVEYFTILTTYVEVNHLSFDPASHWVVDEGTMTVVLRGHGSFTWISTNIAWEETFLYRIRLARDVTRGGCPGKRGMLLVASYEVWSDTGAAYLASIGQLNNVQRAYDQGHLPSADAEAEDDDDVFRGRQRARTN